jgi:hypothetical protein
LTGSEKEIYSTDMIETPKKRKYSRPPTLKQVQALQYMNQGMSKRKALLKAGYSNEVASHPTKAFMKSAGVKQIAQTMYMELAMAGITSEFMIDKFKEWLNATKQTNSYTEPDKTVPDYAIQLKAYQEWKKIVDQHDAEHNPTVGQIKRRLTIDEFVTGKEGGEDSDVIVGDSD